MRKFISILAAAGLCATGALVATSTAHATSPKGMTVATSLGGALTSGTKLTAFNLVTAGTCSSGNYIQVSVTGSGFPAGGYNMTGRDATSSKTQGSNYNLPLLETMADAAAAQTPAATLSGTYTFTANCYQGLTATVLDTFSTTIVFTDATNWVVPVATTTSISVSPRAITVGDSTTLTATVTPSNATGSVEFFATPAGGAQVSLGTAAVSGGTASLSTAALQGTQVAGAYQRSAVSATFTGSGAFQSSSSAASAAASVDVRSDSLPLPSGGAQVVTSHGETTGTNTDAYKVTWTSVCPTNNAYTTYQMFLTGDGFPAAGYALQGITTRDQALIGVGEYKMDAALSLKDAAAEQSPAASFTAGSRYDVEVRCFSRNDGEGFAYQRPIAVVASGSIWFTTATAWQSTDPNQGGASTSMALTAAPVAPKGTATASEPVLLTATIEPSTATGTVSFVAVSSAAGAAAINLGSASVSGGVATLTTTALPAASAVSQYTVTATYTPADGSYTESTGQVLVSVIKENVLNTVSPVVSPAPKVGKASTCSTGIWSGARSYSIVFKVGTTTVKTTNGVSAGGSASYTPVAADAGKNLTCTVSGTGALGTVVDKTTTAIKVALGDAVKVSVAPKITGTLAVTKTVTASPGTWLPSGATFTYQWVKYAGTKTTAIAGATSASFKIPAALKGATIGVTVTAKKAGYANGTTTVKASSAVK